MNTNGYDNKTETKYYRPLIDNIYELSNKQIDFLINFREKVFNDAYIDIYDSFDFVYKMGIAWDLFLEFINYDSPSDNYSYSLDELDIISIIETKGFVSGIIPNIQLGFYLEDNTIDMNDEDEKEDEEEDEDEINVNLFKNETNHELYKKVDESKIVYYTQQSPAEHKLNIYDIKIKYTALLQSISEHRWDEAKLLCETFLRMSPNDIETTNIMNNLKIWEKLFVKDDILILCCSDSPIIYLPPNIKKIGDNAFINCKNLLCIYFSSEIEIIGANAFKNCYLLEQINLSGPIRVIGNNAFYNCHKLCNISNQLYLNEIPNNAFTNCYELKNISFTSELELIEEGAFRNCYNLTSVKLGDNLHTIKKAAFENCIKLNNINITSKIMYIDNDAFINCNELSHLQNYENVKKLNHAKKERKQILEHNLSILETQLIKTKGFFKRKKQNIIKAQINKILIEIDNLK